MANQQNPFGNASAQLLEFLRFAQEFDDLAQLFLGFIHAGHIFECDLFLLHGEQSRPALAKTQCFVSAGLHLPDHYEPQHTQQYEWRELDDGHGPVPSLTVFVSCVDVFMIVQRLLEGGIVGRNHQVIHAAVAKLAAGHAALDRHIGDLAIVKLCHELGIRDLVVLAAIGTALNDSPEDDGDRHQRHPQDHRFKSRIH